MSFNPIEKRMETLMVIIDEAIIRASTREEQLMLACSMMQRTKEIFDATIGEENRKTMFKDMT